jgi:hypothetical protein
MILKDAKMATWTGHGVGTMKKDVTASYRGAVYYQTSPPRWARLNNVAVVFEYEVDAEGNTRSDFWEWKWLAAMTRRRYPPALRPELHRHDEPT